MPRSKGFLSELRRRGYAVLPQPRFVQLEQQSALFHDGWRLELTNTPESDIAIETLRSRLHETHGIDLPALDSHDNFLPVLRLEVRPNAIDTATGDARDAEAYRLEIQPDRITLLANAAPGLFYGVQTLLQLLEGDGQTPRTLPVGTIIDWPEQQLRCIHWDIKHHMDRMETMQRYIDQLAMFKANAVVIELEDKFAYPSHPVIAGPGALSPQELQGLVDYALRRHIQIIPNIQAPAHMGFVLKHEEFAHLRCDGSNYQICMDMPEARKLIFDLYDDVCAATKGVDYFFVSTDEVYYAGICETNRKPYNPQNRSLTWVDFVLAAHEHLTARGRRVMLWAEFPLLPEHIEMLPSDLIDGIFGLSKDDAFIQAERKRGIRQLLYCPIQGAEPFFPNYFASSVPGRGHGKGRLADAVATTRRASARRGQPIGTFAASWDDAGLHNETFWLGWAVMSQGAWCPGEARLEQIIADFMDHFYGPAVSDMPEIYRDLDAQARFWASSWDREPSTVRGDVYGSSHGKNPYRPRDLTLKPPALPTTEDLSIDPIYTADYAPRVEEAFRQRTVSDRLLMRLHGNISRARKNRYNLEVLLSIAELIRHHIDMFITLADVEQTFPKAAEAHASGDHAKAVGILVAARATVRGILEDLHDVFVRIESVWNVSRRPKNAPAQGREYLHVFDDVKDHFADRRVGWDYMIAPAESIGLPEWCDRLEALTHTYARAQGMDVQGPQEEPMDD